MIKKQAKQNSFKINIYQPINSIKSIIIISKLIGVFPLGKENEKKETLYGKVYIIFLLFSYFILFSVTVQPDDDDIKLINRIINSSVYLSLLINYMSILINSFKKRSDILEIFNNFNSFDQDFSTFQIIDYKNCSKIAKVLSVVITILLFNSWVSEVIIMVYGYNYLSIFRNIGNYLPIFIIDYFLVFLSLLAFMLYQRFSAVNKHFKFLCVSRKSRFQIYYVKPRYGKSKGVDAIMIKFKEIQKLNDNLRNLANQVCSCFKLPIFITFGVAFLNIMVNLYYFIILLRGMAIESEVKEIQVNGTNAANHTTVQPDTTSGGISDVYPKFSYCFANLLILHILPLLCVITAFHWAKNEVIIFKIYLKR